MFWLYLAVLMVIAYSVVWLRTRRVLKLLSGLPSYPRLPLIGNLLNILGDGRTLYRILEDASAKAEEASKPFVLWVTLYPVLMFSDPDDVKIITNSFIEKPFYYDFGKAWIGDGLVTAPGHVWKKNIKKLAGTFSAAVVESYQTIFNSQGQKLVQTLKNRVGCEPFDIMHILAYNTLETICQTALGVSDISSGIITDEYYMSFNRALELLIRRGLNPLYYPDWIYRHTADHDEYMKCIAVLKNVSDTALKNRMIEREMDKNCDKQKYSGNGTRGERKVKTFIDIILDMRAEDPSLSEQQIRSEMDTIIVGGQETTATTLFYVLLMAGCEPEVQRKMYDEIHSIFGDSRRPVEKEDLARMQYCEAVICETLRLFPPLPGVMRLADREIQLKSCTVPSGTMCCINAWGAGRSARAWGARAGEFRPQRWLEDDIDRAAFLTFSYGRRACIGKKYAMSSIKTMVAHCIRELEFSSEAHSLEFKVDIALRPISGHHIRVALRNT